MAQKSTCDKCEKDAIAKLTFQTTVTTPITMDVCEEHLAEIKRIMRLFTGQDAAE